MIIIMIIIICVVVDIVKYHVSRLYPQPWISSLSTTSMRHCHRRHYILQRRVRCHLRRALLLQHPLYS